MQEPTRRPAPAERALDALCLLLSGVRYGLGAYLGVYLLTQHAWDEASIGLALSMGGLVGLLSQTPIGLLVDATRAKRPLLAGAVVVVTATCLVIPLAPVFGLELAVKLILELRGEKDAVQEPAYTETIAEAAPQDTPEQPAPQDTAPEAPIQEAPAQEEPEEDAGAYQPDRILELQPGQLNWVVVTGDYDLYFSVPEGFVETPIGFSVNGNIYCYYAQTLDMLALVHI